MLSTKGSAAGDTPGSDAKAAPTGGAESKPKKADQQAGKSSGKRQR
jgi:hypothetical protein